jgi:hypothetical protein
MSRVQLIALTLAAGIVASVSLGAQEPSPYTPPRTEHGHPDFQGFWATEFLTGLERPPFAQALVANPEQAKTIVATFRSGAPALVDPDFHLHNIQELARVKGEYRTSIIVDPTDGNMPFTQAGLDVATAVERRASQEFDGPEQRPLAERCLENLGYAPMRSVPVFLPRQIVQTRDYVAIMSEDAIGLRVIHLPGAPQRGGVPSVEGSSAGRWDGDTLVVETTRLRAGHPAREVDGRPLVISANTKITERFTRVSDRELFYRFTVEDAALYTQPWSGEFSMTRFDGRVFEYACHEGNYSLPNILRGGQAEAAKKAAK